MEVVPGTTGTSFEKFQVKQHSWRFALLVALLLFEAGLCETGFLVIYAEPQASIESDSGQSLGMTGKPFDPKLPSSDEQEIVFVLRAEGHQEKSVRFQAGQLREVKRLPAQGSYRLAAEKTLPPAWLGLPVLLVIGWILYRRRKEDFAPAGDQEFQLGKLLGKGATSKIYEGTAPGLGDQKLAIKILDRSDSDGMAARFLRSLQSTLELDHPNLVKIYRSGATDDSQPYLIMERLDGRDLKNYLKTSPSLEGSKIFEILEPICRVLHYLHGNGIVHRDVKPENIFLCENGSVKLMDLEISRANDAEDFTATGVAVGTPFYISPEQARGKPCPQSDQYAVGILLFQMLSGDPPFKGPSAIEVINKHLKEPIPYLDEATDLQNAVIQKLTSKRAESRFDDMLEALEAIQEALGETDQEQTGTVY